jgi:hypothetical protein
LLTGIGSNDLNTSLKYEGKEGFTCISGYCKGLVK